MRWPRVSGAQAALYAAVLLVVGFEVARSVARADLVVFKGYVTLGEAVLQGADPYDARFTDPPPFNTWPPFFGIVAAGLALLARISFPGALLLWQVGSVLALWGAIRLLARFFEDGGAGLRFWPSAPGALSFASAAVFVPVLLTARVLQEHLQHTQVNILLLFLVLSAFHLMRTGRQAAGGLSLALAASLKAVPVVFLPYLLYKRAWRAAAWTGAFLLLLNVVVPAAVFGPGGAARQWGAWRALAARETAAPTSHYNQSLLAALKRLLSAEGGAGDPVRPVVAAWPAPRVTRLFTVLALAGAAGLALAFRRHPRGLADRSAALEVAICLPAATLVAPLAWKAHFVTLLAGYWAVWWGLRQLPARSPGRRWRVAALGLSAACVTLSAPAIVGERVNDALESLNVITIGALLVVGLGLSLLRPLRRQTPASSAAPSRP